MRVLFELTVQLYEILLRVDRNVAHMKYQVILCSDWSIILCSDWFIFSTWMLSVTCSITSNIRYNKGWS